MRARTLTVVEYLKAPPSRDELKRLYQRAGITPRQGLRDKEPLAAELGLDRSVGQRRRDSRRNDGTSDPHPASFGRNRKGRAPVPPARGGARTAVRMRPNERGPGSADAAEGLCRRHFPMADSRDAGDIFWVEPRNRAIIPLDGFHLSRSLAKRVRSGKFTVTRDRAFHASAAGLRRSRRNLDQPGDRAGDARPPRGRPRPFDRMLA